MGQEAGEQPCTEGSGGFDASSVSVTSVSWQPEGSPVSWGAQGWGKGTAQPCCALVQPHLESWGQFWCLNRRRTSEHVSVSRGQPGQPRWGKAWRARKCQNKRRIMLCFSLWYADGTELKPYVYSCKSHSGTDYLSLLFTIWHMYTKSQQMRQNPFYCIIYLNKLISSMNKLDVLIMKKTPSPFHSVRK